MRVLIVEQDEDTSNILKEIIESLGSQVYISRSSAESLVLLEMQYFDLILLDHYTCARDIKLYKNIHSKVIVMTTLKDAENEFKNIPVEKFIKKPFDMTEIETYCSKCV